MLRFVMESQENLGKLRLYIPERISSHSALNNAVISCSQIPPESRTLKQPLVLNATVNPRSAKPLPAQDVIAQALARSRMHPLMRRSSHQPEPFRFQCG